MKFLNRTTGRYRSTGTCDRCRKKFSLNFVHQNYCSHECSRKRLKRHINTFVKVGASRTKHTEQKREAKKKSNADVMDELAKQRAELLEEMG